MSIYDTIAITISLLTAIIVHRALKRSQPTVWDLSWEEKSDQEYLENTPSGHQESRPKKCCGGCDSACSSGSTKKKITKDIPNLAREVSGEIYVDCEGVSRGQRGEGSGKMEMRERGPSYSYIEGYDFGYPPGVSGTLSYPSISSLSLISDSNSYNGLSTEIDCHISPAMKNVLAALGPSAPPLLDVNKKGLAEDINTSMCPPSCDGIYLDNGSYKCVCGAVDKYMTMITRQKKKSTSK